MADQRQNMAPSALAAALLTVALLGGPAAHRAWGDGAERRAKYEGVQHPRLLVTPEKVEAIREAIGRKGSHFQIAYVAMAARAEADPGTNYTNDARPAYWPVYASRELAFLSLIEKDPAKRRHYAAMAAKALPDLGYVKHGGFKSTSLGHAMATFGVALTYDWAYNEWTDAERAKAEMLLEYFLAHWAKSKRLDPAKASGYNFYGVIYGAEATALLASGAEGASPRTKVVVDALARHLADIGGQLGAHNEGIGYTEYPMSFAIPAAMALADHGHQAPLKAAREHAFWKLNLYAQTFMTSYQRKCIPYGVGHAGNHNEGFASLAMGLCPPESLPYYVWFYDHHMGRLAKARDRYRFDGDRGSTPMSLLFYPPDVEPKDPTGVLPKTAMDGDGYIFFRNRWKDENDVQVALLASAKRSGGWSQDEHLNLRLMAFDTHFFGGPGKERGPENYTTLLVDGHNAPPSKKDFQAGEIVAFEPGEAGGYAIVAGGGHYRSLGVTGARRHLLVHFAPPADGSAILATLDDVTSESEHTYTWQANLGPEGVTMPRQPAEQGPKETGRQLPGLGDVPDAADDLSLPEMLEEKPEAQHKPKPELLKPIPNDDGIDSTTGSESDRPTFLLDGRNNAFVKGWVVHPADATVKSGDPLQLTIKGTNAKIWVVMIVGQGKAPAAVIDGAGISSVVKVAGRTVRWDAAKSRVVCE